MANNFHGCCPLCSEQLLWDDDHPETAYCPAGHYACEAKKFSQLWDIFDATAQQYGIDKASDVFSKGLLRDLRALNTVTDAK